ncbi:hypothetical protein [Marinobacter persicus]|uniref:Uncharacterized protein n=1 Tax=Marinobacter persicus TaxID=930118 RepID=A0A2S6G2L6_9GAMM|nr:hypothetical protein [Marinobacter persicus]PPK50041.1 hypothetical protein BY455_13611 [Marinobacter persicus]PPK52227.1 hypothetical protein B0H24_103611 [Marinobacter persicus]PPK56618.1 hypothetical protein BY454_13611 [Marinobacter persicus]
MIYLLGFFALVAWLSLGLLSYKATNDLLEIPLESLPLPFRLVAILFAPIGLLLYERHLFWSRSKPEVIVKEGTDCD